jgi:hypothetical protein
MRKLVVMALVLGISTGVLAAPAQGQLKAPATNTITPLRPEGPTQESDHGLCGVDSLDPAETNAIAPLRPEKPVQASGPAVTNAIAPLRPGTEQGQGDNSRRAVIADDYASLAVEVPGIHVGRAAAPEPEWFPAAACEA